jgi:ATP-dependent Clp protease ATP-binding subunit ClpA
MRLRKDLKAIQRNRAGLKNPIGQIGIFFLWDQRGGKTQFAKVLAKVLIVLPLLIRIDKSDPCEIFYMRGLLVHLRDKSLQEGGQLTEKVRRKPYSVVLLDEVEKAHPTYSNQHHVLDEGQLTII